MTTTSAPATDPTPPDIPSRPDAAAVPALSVAGVSHSYGPRRALIDVNFAVAPASFTALLGLNGAGKSTLFSLVTRLFGIRLAVSAFSGMTSGLRRARRCGCWASCFSRARSISTCR